jgi:hypothetical protein
LGEEIMDEPTKCIHPFHSVTCFAIKQDMKPGGRAEFKIHFHCNICGHDMLMISLGHAATESERRKVEGDNGELREDPQPGYG